MRTVLHLSDLHFGRINPDILEPMLQFISDLRPNVVAISGDLTQRARTAEFRAAREFLDRIPFPTIVVPGNHDVPLHNLFKRFARKLDRYRRYITPDLQPSFVDDEIMVAGVNTARALTWKDGRINLGQLVRLRETLLTAPPAATKIVVTHHPFDLPAGVSGKIVGRSRLAMKTLAECQVDLLLAGHFHIAGVSQTAARYHLPGYSAVIVSSGTSTSTRGRGQPNSCNVLRIEPGQIAIERHVWQPEAAGFVSASREEFVRTETGWVRR